MVTSSPDEPFLTVADRCDFGTVGSVTTATVGAVVEASAGSPGTVEVLSASVPLAAASERPVAAGQPDADDHRHHGDGRTSGEPAAQVRPIHVIPAR